MCYLAGGSLDQARDHLLTAAEIDDSDVTLWFTIAGEVSSCSYKNLVFLTYSFLAFFLSGPTHPLAP
jgi:hypothetical protein